MNAIRARTREREPTRADSRHRWRWAAATVLAGAVLFFCYLRVAGSARVNSDGAGLVLQASDMLHGNLLLHGWWDTDVSFITTELPEYMAVTAVVGVRPEVVHVCAALTYTLLVLLAAFVARGRARGAEGVVRALLAAGVMLAPQPGGMAVILLGSPDHVGTALPLLALLLLLDRAPDPRVRARWYILVSGAVCTGAAALLALLVVGDPLTVVVGVVPLVLACLLRAVRISAVRISAVRRGRTRRVPDTGNDPAGGDVAAADTSWRAAVHPLLLACAAAAAVPVARHVNGLIMRHHGYQLAGSRYSWQPWHVIAANGPTVWQGILAVFGANYMGVHGRGNAAFALMHLAGVAVVIAAAAFAMWRLFVPARAARAGDLIADFLVIAVALNIAAYFTFFVPVDLFNAHEIGPVASLGAALAGRVLGGPLLRFRRRGIPVLVRALALGLASYVALLGIAAASPQPPPQNAGLAAWLSEHHLDSGLASYWEASSVVVDTGGKVTMLAIGIHGPAGNRRLEPDRWGTDGRLDNPATHRANFVVADPGGFVPAGRAVQMFGRPARTYHDGQYTVMVWDKNLLDEMPRIDGAGPRHARLRHHR